MATLAARNVTGTHRDKEEIVLLARFRHDCLSRNGEITRVLYELVLPDDALSSLATLATKLEVWTVAITRSPVGSLPSRISLPDAYGGR